MSRTFSFTLRKTANATQQRMPDVCTNAITWRRRERQQARVKSCGFVWFVIMRIILHNNDMTVCLCIVYQTTRYTSHIFCFDVCAAILACLTSKLNEFKFPLFLYTLYTLTWLRSASTTWIFLVLVSGFCATAVNAQAFDSLQIACYWLLLILGKNIDWNFSKIGEIHFNRVVLTSLASIVYWLLFSLIQNIALLHSIQFNSL